MPKLNPYVVGLDVGTSRVRVILAEVAGPERLEVVGIGTAESKGLRKGMVVTSKEVVFATAKGGKLYAFDADNGNILWETTLSYEANGQPAMFALNGKQYLVVNATAGFGKDSYDHSIKPGALPKGYVVYALPVTKK